MDKGFKEYFAAVQYLESIFNLPQPDYMIIKNGRGVFIKRMKYFLKLLDNPQNDLKFIHVGGTSGKGSVVNMIQSILTQTGHKVGQYTSPFPTTTLEKYKIGDKLIDPNDFAVILEKMKPAIDRCYVHSPFGRPSYFEICTALAFLYFKQQKCDYVVLEVGLGGQFDATNVIASPVAVVINLVGYDHTDILGKTLHEITRDKSKIIKPKTNFFTTNKNHKIVLDIFKKTCQKNRAKFNLIQRSKTPFILKLLGDFQQDNAALAYAVCQKLGVTPKKIKAGLTKVKLSCRFEIIQKNPYVILDGAHNESKMKTVFTNLKNLTYQKLYLIIALTNERSAVKVFKNIVKAADYIYFTRYQTAKRKCYPPLKLAKNLKIKSKNYQIFLDPRLALTDVLKKAKKKDLILITGSFYLAGELRQTWRDEITILKERKT